jgi:hypothetical protein
VLAIVQEVWDLVYKYTDMSPILVFTVFIVVEFLSSVFHIKTMSSRWRESLLGLMCLGSGILVVAISIPETDFKGVIYNGVILGSFSAISYQIFKPAFKIFVEYILNVLERKMKLNDEDRRQGG